MITVSETQSLLWSLLSEHVKGVWVWEDLWITVGCLIRGNDALARFYFLVSLVLGHGLDGERASDLSAKFDVHGSHTPCSECGCCVEATEFLHE